MHHLYAFGHVNFKVFCFLFSKTTVGWGKEDGILWYSSKYVDGLGRALVEDALHFYHWTHCRVVLAILFQVQTVIQQVQNIINRCLTIHDKLEASLHDLSRTGDVQACKAARKAADASLKELSRELKPLISFLQSSQQATQILPKVQSLLVDPHRFINK